MKRKLLAGAFAVIVSFVVAACGDDDPKSDEGTSAQTPVEIEFDFNRTKTVTIAPTLTPPPYRPATTSKRPTTAMTTSKPRPTR